MRGAIFLGLLLFSAGSAGAAREALGVYFSWGAFRDDRPKRCFAIAEPTRPRRAETLPAASVSYWPGRGVRGQFHVRLSREKRPGSAVLVRIGDRAFQLLAGPLDAWASDPRTDAQIVAAMRTGLEMLVESRGVTGARIRDRYPLRGAATAIDAAAVACAR